MQSDHEGIFLGKRKVHCCSKHSKQTKKQTFEQKKQQLSLLFSSASQIHSKLVYFSKADNLIKKNLIKLSLTKYSNYSLGCYINISEVE